MNRSEVARLVAEAAADIKAEVDLEAEVDLYAEHSAGQAWAEPVDLTPFIDRLRAGGINVEVARIESDGTQGDPPADRCPTHLGNLHGERCILPVGHNPTNHDWGRALPAPVTTSRVLDCATCEGPQPVTDTTRVLGGQHLRLACGHTVRDWNGAS